MESSITFCCLSPSCIVQAATVEFGLSTDFRHPFQGLCQFGWTLPRVRFASPWAMCRRPLRGGAGISRFFEQWVYSPGHPVLDVSYEWDAQEKTLALTVRQTQDTSAGVPVFRLPIKLGITTSAGKKVESVWLEEQEQTFTFK